MIAFGRRLFTLCIGVAIVCTTVLSTGCIETEELTWPQGHNPFDIKCDVEPEEEIDLDIGEVSFACIHPVFEAKCATCHTVGKQGNVEVGNQNILQAYENSQQRSYTGGTIGDASLTRISDGSMPPGVGCTGNPVADKANDLCLNSFEYDLLEAWVESGQPL